MKLTRIFWQVCTFKESPANTPHSLFLLGLISLCYFSLICLQWLLSLEELHFSAPKAILAAAALLASYALYSYFILKLNNISERFVQTLTSLFGCHFIIHLFAIPLLLITPYLAAPQAQSPLLFIINIVYILGTLILAIWQFTITTFIYKEALSIGNMHAVLASIGLIATNILILSFWR